MRRRNLAKMEQADEERRRSFVPNIVRGAGGTIGQAIEPSAGPAQMPPLAPAPSKRGWPKGKPRK